MRNTTNLPRFLRDTLRRLASSMRPSPEEVLDDYLERCVDHADLKNRQEHWQDERTDVWVRMVPVRASESARSC